ncbi:MAG TPA: hypothetical protein VF272_00995 [Candidatus Saccharimonadia bacterium]
MHSIKRFAKDYSLPLAATVLFGLLITGSVVLRMSQRASLADWLDAATNDGKYSSTLLSQDKPEEVTRGNDTPQQLTQTPEGSPTSFAISPNNQPVANPSTPPGGGTPLSPLFSVSIAYFQKGETTLECSTPKPKPKTCSKQYVFNGGVRTQNGPGNVTYSWRSSIQSLTASGSFTASRGEALAPLQKIVTMPCDTVSDFSLQLVVLSPSFVQSTVFNTNHNCNEI